MVRCKKCGCKPNYVMIKYITGSDAYMICPRCKIRTKAYFSNTIDDDEAFLKPEKEWNYKNRRKAI